MSRRTSDPVGLCPGAAFCVGVRSTDVEKFIKAYSNRGELVLDATIGTGIAGIAAKIHGRRLMGIELSAETAERGGASPRP